MASDSFISLQAQRHRSESRAAVLQNDSTSTDDSADLVSFLCSGSLRPSLALITLQAEKMFDS